MDRWGGPPRPVREPQIHYNPETGQTLRVTTFGVEVIKGPPLRRPASTPRRTEITSYDRPDPSRCPTAAAWWRDSGAKVEVKCGDHSHTFPNSAIQEGNLIRLPHGVPALGGGLPFPRYVRAVFQNKKGDE